MLSHLANVGDNPQWGFNRLDHAQPLDEAAQIKSGASSPAVCAALGIGGQTDLIAGSEQAAERGAPFAVIPGRVIGRRKSRDRWDIPAANVGR